MPRFSNSITVGNFSTMAESYLRCLEVLRILPRHPNTITAREIKKRVNALGFNVSVKTIQRDLQSISRLFPITSIEDSRPYGWSWMEDADIVDIPSMDQKTALTFRMVDQFLSQMMPRSTIQFLEPYFNRAQVILENAEKSSLRKWFDKIAVIPKGQSLIKAEIDAGIRDVVYEGVLKDKQILLEYKRLGAEKSKEYPISPLGLVFRNEVVYLVGIARDYEYPAQFPLHRILKAELLNVNAKIPKDLTLKRYIDKGEFAFVYEEAQITLQVVCDKYNALRLEETPLSIDQTVVENENGQVLLTAIVSDSHELREWLWGFGDSVEVVAPVYLREEFRVLSKKLALKYSDH